MAIYESDAPSAQIQRRSRVAGWLMLAFTAVLILGLSFFPAPYVIDKAGPTYDTLGSVKIDDTSLDMILISGTDTFESSGELLMTTVTRLGNPETLPGWLEVVQGWVDPSRSVIPVDVAFPPGTSLEDSRRAAQLDMDNSQQDAVAAALDHVGIPFASSLVVSKALEGGPSEGVLLPGDIIRSANGSEVNSVAELRQVIAESGATRPVKISVSRDQQRLDIEVIPRMSEGLEKVPMIGILISRSYDFPIEVEIALENVGGPSAGLMFTLGIVEKLTENEITRGQIVAGTGTINAEGEIGPVGGIRHKMLGAKQDGAVWFLAPEGNCPDLIGFIPDNLQVVPVSSVSGAIRALESLSNGETLDLCESG